MTRQPSLPLAIGLAAIACLALARPAQANIPHLVYGHSYNFQNSFNSYNGGYLETRNSGCQGGHLCVSTNINPQRDLGSASWVVLSATGKAVGTDVAPGDVVYLYNLWNVNAGYLTASGTGCQNDLMCVNTVQTSTAASEWKVLSPNNTLGYILTGQPIIFQNGYNSFAGGYLDTDGLGCQGDLRCVGTSSTYSTTSSSATEWIAEPALDAAFGDGWCLTTDQPGTILDNGISSLVWDQYGNLTLSNYGAVGRTTDNEQSTATRQVWGINSSVPLTGSTAGKICFTTGGNIHIRDYTGTLVWSSNSSTSTSMAVMSLQGCTLKTKGDDSSGTGLVTFKESTEQCSARQRENIMPMTLMPLVDQCWQASSSTTTLLWDNETQLSLNWVNGELDLVNGADGSTWWSSIGDDGHPGYNTASAANLCFQGTGNLAILDASNNTLWSSNSGVTTGATITMALDSGGFGFWDGINQYSRRDAWFDYAAEHSGPAQTQPQATINNSTPAWCLSKNVQEIILSKPGYATVMWINGYLETTLNPITWYDAMPNAVWQTPSLKSAPGNSLCFQSDGNLVIYDATGGVVWATGSNNVTNGTTPNALALEGVDLAIVNQTLANNCNEYFLHCVNAPDSQCSQWSGYANDCQTTSYYTLWTPNQQAGVAQFTEGGYSFIKDDKVGNSDFAAEAWIVGAAANAKSITALQQTASSNTYVANAINADLPSSIPSDFAMAMGDLGAQVTMFGYTPSSPLFEGNGYIEGMNGALYGHVEVDTLGATLYTLSADTANVKVTFQKELESPFEVSETFDVGIPVTVTGRVGETLGIAFTGSVSLNQFSLTSSPFVALEAVLQCGVGVKDASAGIQGVLTLAELAIPFTTTLTYNDGGTSQYDEKAELEGKMLDGEVDLYAQLGALEATKKLAGWDGIVHKMDLFHQQGDL